MKCCPRWRQPISSATSEPVLLFDLDGTLTDPQVGITRCIQHALAGLRVPSPSVEELRSWIGPPIQDSFADLVGDQVEEAVRLFRERFSEVGIFENEVYPGIPESLQMLTDHGFRLMLATSKPEAFASRILNHFDLSQFFERIYGSQFDGRFSNKADLIGEIIRVEHLDPGCTTMIGDRSHDVVGAAKNGIPCVGVLYGYGTREELLEAGAVRLCATPLELGALAHCAENS